MTENDCLYCGGEKTCRHHLTGRDLEDVYLDPDLWGRLCGSCHPLLHEDWNTADVGDRTSPATFLDSLYLRLRRTSYDEAELAAWAARVTPFLDAGRDAYVFFRHDETGRATDFARSFMAAVDQAFA